MLTEAEAREKWCPFARYDDDACNRWHVMATRNPETNEQHPARTEFNPEPCRCIASACMAWEWAPEQPGDANPSGMDEGGHLEFPDAVGDCGLKRRV